MADPFATRRASTAAQFVSVGHGGGEVSVAKEWDFEDTVLNGFEVNPIAFACMDRTCMVGAGIPWRYEELVQGRWQPIEDPDELALLIRPNPAHSFGQLVWFTIEALMGGGNALWKKVRVGRSVRELWPMNLVRAEPRVAAGRWITGFRVYEAGHLVTIPREDVIHVMRGMSTLKPFWGRSPMMSARITVSMANDQIKWNREIPRNLAVPVGAFVAPGLMTQDQVDEAKKKVKATLSGWRNAREPVILSGGAKWERMGMTPAEIDWMESQRFSMLLTCAALGRMAVEFTGEQMTYNNLLTAWRYGLRNAVVPHLKMIRDTINSDQDFVPQDLVGRRRFTFDLTGEDEVIEATVQRFESLDRAVLAGVRVSDAIQALHLPLPMRPEYDRSYVRRGAQEARAE